MLNIFMAATTMIGILAIPAAPTDQKATALSASQIRVTWTDNSNNETGFQISDGTVTWTVGANSTRFYNSLLSSGVTKCYRVRSYNASGKSAWTPYTCATTL